MTLIQFARTLLYPGLVLTGVGMLLGFPALLLGYQTLAMTLIGLVPIGVLLVFAALVLLVLLGERRHSPSMHLPDLDEDPPRDDEPPKPLS